MCIQNLMQNGPGQECTLQLFPHRITSCERSSSYSQKLIFLCKFQFLLKYPKLKWKYNFNLDVESNSNNYFDEDLLLFISGIKWHPKNKRLLFLTEYIDYDVVALEAAHGAWKAWAQVKMCFTKSFSDGYTRCLK